MTVSRYRMRFEKREALRFISHHDLMRVYELALRRSGLKVAHTQGFNPHPKVSFALALPLGVESLDEIVDIDIEHEADAPSPESVMAQLGEQMPPGLRLLSAEIATGRPRVIAVDYECELPPDFAELDELQERLTAFMQSATHPFSRDRGRGKSPRSFDARAFTQSATLEGRLLKMRLLFSQEGGMKPSDLLLVLQLDPNRFLVTKTRSILAELPKLQDDESSE
ncbi:MAG: TIGR03936 family radical SAM-associated protein [Planctomycetes bacterium]|nr:TIGR03936 family radical SAM-associated protein [Planctomycetota bacterium]